MCAQANDEKMRLEEKQRQERAATQAAGKPWQANWFEQVRCLPGQLNKNVFGVISVALVDFKFCSTVPGRPLLIGWVSG